MSIVHPALRWVAAALVTVAAANLALGDATDPFVGTSGALEPRAPNPEKLNAGDFGVADQTGAATYTYPITLPPGRRSLAPSLALRYSSQAPLRGGVAAGWTLELPSVERQRGQRGSAPRWIAKLGQSSGPLVTVADGTYRTRFDDGLVRFEKTNGAFETWTARTTDGVRHEFNYVASEDRRLLSRQIDAFGNQIDYTYESSSVALPDGTFAASRIPTVIEYTSNAAAGMVAHARVELIYEAAELCPGSPIPIGAALDGYGAPYVESPRRLREIRSSVRDTQAATWRLARKVVLSYDAEALRCDVHAAPLRFLTRIEETGYDALGAATVLPPVTFQYGRHARRFDRFVDAPAGGYPMRGGAAGAESTLLDMDGDGMNDRVEVYRDSVSDTCKLAWYRGSLGGTFAAVPTIVGLPTASWSAEAADLPRQSCSLAGQVTYYRTSDVAIGDFQCNVPYEGVMLGYHFMDFDGDGRVDLLTNLWHGLGYEPHRDPRMTVGGGYVASTNNCSTTLHYVCQVDGEGEPYNCELYEVGVCTSGSGNGSGPEGPGGGGGPPFDASEEEIGCYTLAQRAPEGGGTEIHSGEFESYIDGNYQWRIYQGTGTGFSSGFHTVTSHVALSPSVADSTMDLAPLQASVPSLYDLDGDGWLDGVALEDGILGTNGWLHSRRSAPWNFHGLGGWTSPIFTLAATEHHGSWKLVSGGESPVVEIVQKQIAGIADINGDGLGDLLVRKDGQLGAYLNHGAGFRWTGTGYTSLPLGDTGAIEKVVTMTERLDADRSAGVQWVMQNGVRETHYRLADVDGDGLLDRVDLTGTSPQVSYGMGLGFLAPRSLASLVGQPLERRLTADASGDWRVESELLDANGDGLVDLVDWYGTGTLIRTEETAGVPMRLLTRVENGRGLRIDFHYGSTSDPSVVERVAADALLPHVQPVVTNTVVQAAASGPTSTTTYRYRDPVYRSESGRLDDAPRFLGFRRVTEDRPAGATTTGSRVVRDYTYNIAGTGVVPRDGRGRLAREERYGRNGASLELASVSTTTWRSEPLFGGEALFTHADRALTFTCAPGAADCDASAAGIRRRQETWTAWPDATTPRLYLQTSTLEGEGDYSDVVDGDRGTSREYEIRDAAADYRVLPRSVRDLAYSVFAGFGLSATVGREETGYDAAGLPVQSSVWTSVSVVATTTRTFDATGNVLTVTKPEQALVSGAPHTTYTHDSHKLFVASTTNEWGHVVQTYHDVATGALTQRNGPNSVVVSATCGSFSCLKTKWEGETFTVDGLGRVRERFAAVDNAAGNYDRPLVERRTYQDLAVPNRITIERLRDHGGAVWITSQRDVDGLGRVIADREVRGAAGADAVTSYAYDAAGNLVTVTEPDPRYDSGVTVTTSYGHDALGRLISVLGPDGAGVVVAHDGLSRTISEVTSDGSGKTREETDDVFGRLVIVDELAASGDATTYYGYDTLDRLISIFDDGYNLTSLGHDWTGNRTSITRSGRTWTYQYDRNGNLIAEVTPVPAGGTAADHTTAYDYDDLDRMLWEVPATRGLSSARRTQLGIGTITYQYDAGKNGRGRRTGVGLPFGNVVTTYLAGGLVAGEQRTVMASHLVNLPSKTQQVTNTYNALGAVTQRTWDDGQAWAISYDERGLVASVTWKDPATATWKAVARYTRSIAGAPRKRESDFSQYRDHTYDVLGRPRGDWVYARSGSTWVTRGYRGFVYRGSGDVALITGHANGMLVDTAYEYDDLQRLKKATGPSGYVGQFTYSTIGNIATADIAGPPALARRVSYEYAGVDPHAVTRLTDLSSGAEYGLFGYDRAGNMTSRKLPAGTQTHVWDGNDQLREVTSPSGATEVYYYDHEGQRVLALNATSGARWWFGESETQYTTTGAQQRRYLHLADAAGALARVENGTTIELQYVDALHNLFLALGPAGTTTAAFVYTPFGEVIASAGATTHRRTFNSKESDLFSDLRYYGARYYDPILLRWNAADPLYAVAPERGLREPQRLNLYAFAGNNPVRYWDPDGREEVSWWDTLTKDLTFKVSRTDEGKPGVTLYKKSINDDGGSATFSVGPDSVAGTVTGYDKELVSGRGWNGGQVTVRLKVGAVQVKGKLGDKDTLQMSITPASITYAEKHCAIGICIKGAVELGPRVTIGDDKGKLGSWFYTFSFEPSRDTKNEGKDDWGAKAACSWLCPTIEALGDDVFGVIPLPR